MTNKNLNDGIAMLLFFSTLRALIRLGLSLPQSEMRSYAAASFPDEISIRQWKLLTIASTPNLYGWSRAICRALCVRRYFWRLTNFRFSIKTHEYQKPQWPNIPVIFFNLPWTQIKPPTKYSNMAWIKTSQCHYAWKMNYDKTIIDIKGISWTHETATID